MNAVITVDVIIIGAGAAGMMCAIEAGKRGRSVTILDHSNKPGKKILMSGGGRCNFTNIGTTSENFISHNPHFCKSALKRYTPWHFIDLVNKHNIAYHEKTLGQLFCDNKSSDIVNMLLTECRHAKVKIQLNTDVKHINKQSSQYHIKTSTGEYQCQSLVIATGGLSIPTMGASAFGYEVAKQYGIKVWPTTAALVPFTLHNHDKNRFEELSGIAVDCQISCNSQKFTEAMLFTHRGLSGPAVLQISSYWQPGDNLTIALLPDVNLYKILCDTRDSNPKILLKNFLAKFFAKRLVSVFIAEDCLELAMQSLSNEKLKTIADAFHHWQIKPNATEGYRTAEVTLGGVDTNAISSKTFEVNNVQDLYFIGEVLDVTGWVGGYNFQWAWASGYAAGQYV
jgi:predicted Rossmann fold flavoprotein